MPIMASSNQIMQESMASAMVNNVATSVAPVGVAVAPSTSMAALPGTAFLPMGITQALVGKEPGKFSGTSDGWPTWRRRWLGYLKEVEEIYPNITNRQ